MFMTKLVWKCRRENCGYTWNQHLADHVLVEMINAKKEMGPAKCPICKKRETAIVIE